MFSIIIPSFNNYRYLKLTIDSIKKNSKFQNELLVHVNEDNNGETRNYLKQNNIFYTYTEKNVGLCTSINIIAKKANKEYLIYSHDDMYFCPNWETPLLNRIKDLHHNQFYFSASMIEPNSGHIVFDCGLDIDTFDEKKLLDNYMNLDINDHQGSHFAPHCIHKDIWNKVNGFSEEFNPGMGSDPDFNMKLWNEGIRIFRGLSDFKVYHFGSITTRKNQKIIQNKGDITFLKKWGISTKFFIKHYLRSKTKYNGPLDNPKKNIFFYIDLFKCKIKLLYLKLLTAE
jgi:glycosyltransferase involved in cell wall biosynthesis